jgi:hypothetical protein
MNRKFDELDAEVRAVPALRGVEFEYTSGVASHTWIATLLGLRIRFGWYNGRWAVRHACGRMPVTVYRDALLDAIVDFVHAYAECAIDELRPPLAFRPD